MSLGGNKNELACVYAALILHDEGLDITSEHISSILAAAGVEVEAYWPALFAKLCKGKDMGAMISALGSGGGGAAPVAAAGAAAPAAGGGGAPAAAKKAPEPEPEEEEEDMGFDLFD
ncbi:hypothetical protein AB1Y20_022841 [Prymnesium parvum]|uniref:60S acidic ribosomal protein P1 n=1 Tax=Prymnesium parvum TaxID=97485 RepID=A0AB34JC24_PRYPA